MESDILKIPILNSGKLSSFAWHNNQPGLGMPQPSYEVVHVPLDKLAEMIHRQVDEIQDTGAHPTDILMGRDMYCQFIDFEIKSYFKFRLPSDSRIPRQPQWREIIFADLTVHCLPWMLGLVVTPALTVLPPGNNKTNTWSASIGKTIVAAEPVDIADAVVEANAAKQVLQGLQQAFAEWTKWPSKFSVLKIEIP